VTGSPLVPGPCQRRGEVLEQVPHLSSCPLRMSEESVDREDSVEPVFEFVEPGSALPAPPSVPLGRVPLAHQRIDPAQWGGDLDGATFEYGARTRRNLSNARCR